MSDKELLEMAAKAAGYKWSKRIAQERDTRGMISLWLMPEDGSLGSTAWNPLENDGDALRLAVTLRLSIVHEKEYFAHHEIPTIEVVGEPDEKGSRHCEMHSLDDDPCAATRRAIVRAAAVVGKAMT